MPEAFKDKYLKRVIIDCTEIKCEIPSSLLLNSEQYSSYKNHTALEGLISIAPNGPITFVSELYTGSISDRGIVIHNGFFFVCFYGRQGIHNSGSVSLGNKPQHTSIS